MSLKSLSTYRKKRDFDKTGEPSGDVKVAPAKQRRFVIQKHDATRLHYDLRLEFDGVFKSWAVTRGPSLDPRDKRLAVEVEDHPLDYGDFEGTIPDDQYGGGTVMLWDRGFWESDDPERGFKKGDLKFTLHGGKLHGSWVLVRMKGDRYGGKRTNWLLIKHRDEFAKEGEANDILDEDRSVASGRAMAQIAEGKGKAPKPFMLAKGKTKADAVWQSNRGDAAEARGKRKTAALRAVPETKTRAPAQAVKPKKVCSDARFRHAAALRLRRTAAQLRRLVPRGQVRRLSRTIAGRGRRCRVEHPQGTELDRKVRRHRQGSEITSRSPDRRRDRCPRSERRPGFFGAAGGIVGRQDQ